ncbi:MAG TPA: DUF177 domain-containing protein [Vulgatibacter sp.]|nr:DUF177 domain-containing protein [Vulgatibacter sp.]
MEIRIHVDQIKEGGLQVEREFDEGTMDEVLQAEPSTGYHAKRPSTLRARLTRVNDRDILFAGEIPLHIEGACGRCLRCVQVDATVRFSLDLVDGDEMELLGVPSAPEDDGAGEIAGSFSPEEAEQVFFTGKELDLGPLVREQILLGLPMNVRCGDECRGLCQVCGQNLNDAECGCDRRVPDPRWAGLRNIKV